MSATPLHTRLRAAEDHLRRTAAHLEDGLRAEILAHADAVAEAAADAMLEDTRLFLPVDFVRQQQAGLEARIKALESERDLWRVSSVCREKEAELVALREDKRRLDLLRAGCTLWKLASGEWELTTEKGDFTEDTLDAAIDAAMNK